MYRHLNSQYITATLRTLKNRIYERFPKSNLNRVCQELSRSRRNPMFAPDRPSGRSGF